MLNVQNVENRILKLQTTPLKGKTKKEKIKDRKKREKELIFLNKVRFYLNGPNVSQEFLEKQLDLAQKSLARIDDCFEIEIGKSIHKTGNWEKLKKRELTLFRSRNGTKKIKDQIYFINYILNK